MIICSILISMKNYASAMVKMTKFKAKIERTTRLFGNNPVEKLDPDYFRRPGPWDEPNLDSLLEANKKWSSRVKLTNPQYFETIKRGHAPKILWIGCSDARVGNLIVFSQNIFHSVKVPANEIIGEPAGSVFVHRNIANMVVNTDFNCLSVIQVNLQRNHSSQP